MLETYWLVAEGAAVAVPAAGAAAYAAQGRKRLHRWLGEPLFWDGGQPVSLVTVFAELNGEPDFTGGVRQVIGGAGPLTPAEVERAVRVLQASAGAARDYVLDQATETVLRGAFPGGEASAAGMQLMARLSEAYAEQGFFRFMAGLNAERARSLPALLPVEGVQAGGLPIAAEPDPHRPGEPGAGVLGVLKAVGLGGGTDWLPTVAKAVEDLVRERQVKKARDAYVRTLQALGAAAVAELRRKSPAGQQLRRNVYSPLDAYRTLEARARARRPAGRGVKHLLVPAVEDALWHAYGQSLHRATAIVGDKCLTLERVLLGKQGVPFAGEVLFRHREGLLAGVAEDAFPIAPAEAAYEDYVSVRQQSAPGS